MKAIILYFLLLLIVPFQVNAQTEDARKKNFNTKKGVAIEGYDPVSFFNGKPKEGRKEFQITFKAVTYLFDTQANLARFKSNPASYEPAYGGWCAFAMGDNGEKVRIDPETYKIKEGKLYLFYNFWGNNTLTDWNEKEEELKAKGDLNWAKFVQ